MNNTFMTGIIAVLLAGCCRTANAQLIQVSGYIYQQGSNMPVPFANIQNKRNNTGATTDQSGFYIFLLAPGDTVEITAIGYRKKKMAMPQVSGSSYSLDVSLEKTDYELSGVTIGFNYERFINDFKKMSIPQKSKIIVGDPTIYKGYVAPKERFGVTFSPIDFVSGKFSKKAKELEKYQDLIANDNKEMSANMKLTKEFIIEITGITEKEIPGFLMHCNLSDEFIADATRYDLKQEIDKCYLSYLALKKQLGITVDSVAPRDTIKPE